MAINEIEIVRNTNGKIKSVTIDDVPLLAHTVVVSDTVDDLTEVTIVMKARVKGRTE